MSHRGETEPDVLFRKPPLYPSELRGQEANPSNDPQIPTDRVPKRAQPDSAGEAPSSRKTSHLGTPEKLNARPGRLARLVELNSVPEPNTGCWLWLRSLDEEGYGKVWDSATGRRIAAHRASYIVAKGPIPDGLQIDHLCRVRCCVAPHHLEAVTPRENTMRSTSWAAEQAKRTHCIRGHALAGENLLVQPNGSRHCKTCQAAKSREHYLRNADRIKAKSAARRRRLATTATASLAPTPRAAGGGA